MLANMHEYEYQLTVSIPDLPLSFVLFSGHTMLFLHFCAVHRIIISWILFVMGAVGHAVVRFCTRFAREATFPRSTFRSCFCIPRLLCLSTLFFRQAIRLHIIWASGFARALLPPRIVCWDASCWQSTFIWVRRDCPSFEQAHHQQRDEELRKEHFLSVRGGNHNKASNLSHDFGF
jgi:hypothetical protein